MSEHQWRAAWRMVLVTFPLAAGCGVQATEVPVQVTPAVRTAAQSSNEFALDLYQQLRTESGNLFFSPGSIATALTMTSAGARGQTQQQMQQVLHLRLPDQQLHATLGTLGKLLITAP